MAAKRRRPISLRPRFIRPMAEPLEARWMLSNNPRLTSVVPANGATGVALNVAITAALNLPNGGLDPATVTAATVTLKQTVAGTAVPAVVNTTGGGDAIILTPSANLLPSTQYTFSVSAAVKDVNGDSVVTFGEKFTTGATAPPVNQTIAFQKVALPTTQGTPFTDMQIGPDGKMYASTEDGRIFRFAINGDGTLGTPQIITSLQTAEGGNRLISGFAFDPAATAADPIIWVSNTFYALTGATNGVNFTGKLTVMSGADLGTVQDAIIDLPRSISDHVNDQPVFGPDGDLYFCQAGENAFGAPDTTWGNRAETLLSGAILRVDTKALDLSTPLNVLTPESGGTYNPFAVGSPLTIYATGVRNAFDIFFDETGALWAPVNGSAAGGNTPAFSSSNSKQINGPRIDTGQSYAGPNVPGITDVMETEEDVLDKIVAGGYYGHPNPTRGEYVLDDGHPKTGGVAGLMFPDYPLGTNPDPNYHFPNFVFGLDNSPDSMIEYHGNAFGGALDGKFLISEYSAGDDIAVLSRDGNDNITGADRSITGFGGFKNPLAMIENPATGYIYISELGANKLTLLKPSTLGAKINVSEKLLAFNTIAKGNAGAAASPAVSLTITNNGLAALKLAAAKITITNDPASPNHDAGDFAITDIGTLPATLATDATFTFTITFTAQFAGLASAFLNIATNDPASPTATIALRGLGTTGLSGANEPSLAAILRTDEIPTLVGDGPGDANAFAGTNYPDTPDASSQEMNAQQLVKANASLPVTLTPLASFGLLVDPTARVGWYEPGDSASLNQLFTISKADAQSVNPAANGTTSFDPGAAPFSLYVNVPGFVDNGISRVAYSEDTLNVWDAVNQHHIRFFPLENADGSIVPNAYLMAAEESNVPPEDFNDVVAVVTNVTPAALAIPAAPMITSADGTPGISVAVSWTASAGATAYIVSREDPGAATFKPIAAGIAATSYTDTTVIAGATYHYQVQAESDGGISPASGGVKVTPDLANAVPKAPTNLTTDGSIGSQIVLNWNESAGAFGYIVKRQSENDPAFLQVAANLTSPTYADTSVVPGVAYQYEIVAVNVYGNSLPSTVTNGAIPAGSQAQDVTVGAGGNKLVQFTDADGTLSTLRIKGPGSATVHFVADAISQSAIKFVDTVTGTNVSIANISITGTTTKSTLAITAAKGDSSVTVGGISADGSLHSISAPAATLIGALAVTGTVGAVTFGSAHSSTLTIGGPGLSLQIGSATAVAVTSAGAIQSIAATTWNSDDAITAPAINTISIKGNATFTIHAGSIRTMKIGGTLQGSDIDLTVVGQLDLKSLSAGAISATAIIAAGSLGAIAAATLSNSQIKAGLNDLPPDQPFPTADDLGSAAISSVKLKKIANAASFVNSTISANQIGTLELGAIQFDNAGMPFGAAAMDIGALIFTDPANGKSLTFRKITTPAVAASIFSGGAITPGDFEVEIV